MIEDEKDGIKIAENPLEVLWMTVKKNCENNIKNLENSLIVEKAVLLMTLGQLKGLSKA